MFDCFVRVQMERSQSTHLASPPSPSSQDNGQADGDSTFPHLTIDWRHLTIDWLLVRVWSDIFWAHNVLHLNVVIVFWIFFGNVFCMFFGFRVLCVMVVCFACIQIVLLVAFFLFLRFVSFSCVCMWRSSSTCSTYYVLPHVTALRTT